MSPNTNTWGGGGDYICTQRHMLQRKRIGNTIDLYIIWMENFQRNDNLEHTSHAGFQANINVDLIRISHRKLTMLGKSISSKSL